jgi:hypothetical protein
MITTNWYSIDEKQPEQGDEIYINTIYGNKILLGVWYVNEVDGKEYPQVLHIAYSNSTPTSIEYIEYWSYSLKELQK